MTIISLASIGIGSVGISLLPVLPTTFSTSGNFSIKIFDACCTASVDVFRLLPESTLVSTAKSPSGRVGINSPPNLVNRKIENVNNTKTENITIFENEITLLSDFS